MSLSASNSFSGRRDERVALRPRQALVRQPDVLGLQVLLDAFKSALTAETGLLDTAEGRRRIGRVADILKFPLLHLDSRSDWTNWLRGVGLDDTGAIHGPVLNRASMVIDAAINGQGLALARTTLSAWVWTTAVTESTRPA